MTNAAQAGAEHVLLICTVGGTPEPLVKALLHWRPDRVVFIPSEQTRAQVDTVLRGYAEAAGTPLSPGQYALSPVPDAENLLTSVRTIRRLDHEVADWLRRGAGEYGVVVDFTGGTKCMTAALALVARRWRCRYSYVGGQQRTKEGVGVVQTGAERVVHSANPWDAFGYQAVEDAVAVFNHGGYAAAAALLDGALRNAGPEVKRELSTLKAVIDAYAAWDRFDHHAAAQRFADALRNRNDLTALFSDAAPTLAARLERHRDRVKALADEPDATIAWVADLIDNAARRAAEHRFDDAVARLYRAVEALAQIRLRQRYAIADTKRVSLEHLPAALQSEWASRGRDGRTFMLALQDAYRVLKEFGDELGTAFFACGLAVDLNSLQTQKSPLVARNHSILAHGFEPVRETVYRQLYEHLLKLLSSAGEAFTTVEPWSLPQVAVTAGSAHGGS